jgi:hypothetical protein
LAGEPVYKPNVTLRGLASLEVVTRAGVPDRSG